MPSTYSTSLGLELIGNGEQAGTWGTTTNNNLGTLLEAAIAGVQPITLTGGDYTLTDYNGLPDESRNAVLVFNGLLAAPCNVIAPAVEKTYIVRNRANATVTIKTATGNGIAIANAASEVIFCDGSDFYSATQFNYIDGDLTVSGTAYANNVVATNNITLGKDLFANASTGQIYLPTGDQNTRTSSPIVGLIRYNTTGQFYEGYTNAAWVRFTVAPQGNYTITYAIAAGGGGGGGNSGGGGGAGGLTQNTLVASPGTVYTMTIGAGGAAGSNGNDSSIVGTATTTGGGHGGTFGPGNGTSGGSGGGGSGCQAPGQFSYGGSGTTSQGYAGGGSGPDPYTNTGGGGGGGSQAAGAGGGFSAGGAGGSGTTLTITGIPLAVCGGGGGCTAPYTAGGSGGAGGNGGGGSGSTFGGTGTAGGTNTGGGGGGGSTGAAGGSGVIYISMPTVSFSGVYTGLPTITTYGSTTVLKYTNSGTYTA